MSGVRELHTLTVDSPLGEGALEVRAVRIEETLGRPFEMAVDLLAKSPNLEFDKLLGRPLRVLLALDDESSEVRAFHGITARIAQRTEIGGRARFIAAVRPWAWFLGLRANSRIFQEKTAPDIILEILREHADWFELRLSNEYPKREYCVQYDETDLDFISRLMEEEGIYFFFRHEAERHVMVLCDSPAAHEPFPGAETMPYAPSEETTDEQRLWEWGARRDVRTCGFAARDFDFARPHADLSVQRGEDREYGLNAFEVFEYPGGYYDRGAGEHYARVRMRELHAEQDVARAEGNVLRAATGGVFQLTGHSRKDQNARHLIVSSILEARNDQAESGLDPSDRPPFRCRLRCIPADRPFAAPRRTPLPSIAGPQTAIVTGPSGQEIWCDKHGRVKVQFHWDREGKQDENSSCWVRVSQEWAGRSWGGITIPRIGQEVIVEFLEGNPDRPLITGRVYNGEQKPPYALPGNKTQSGLQSRSTPGGGPQNFNEIKFEDKIGSELLSVQAEKDRSVLVKNNNSENVGNDESLSVGHDRTKSVGNDETTSIGANRTETVGSNETITIGGDRTESVVKNETITIALDRTESVGKNETVTVALARTHTVGVNDALTVGAAQEVTVGGAQAITVGAVRSVTVGASMTTDVGGDRKASIGKNDSLKAGKKIVIDAGDEILIKTGDASILLKKDGTIQIKGKDIKIKGSGKISAQADGDMVLKGSKITQN